MIERRERGGMGNGRDRIDRERMEGTGKKENKQGNEKEDKGKIIRGQ